MNSRIRHNNLRLLKNWISNPKKTYLLIQQQGISVLLTQAPRFYDKAKLFLNAGATFVLGTDTAERLLNPK
jgi:hypothetical protein